MKRNGFTIVEILGVIVVMAAIMVLLVPNLSKTSTRAKEKLYEAKISNIEKAATLYAQDNYSELISESVNSIITKTITSDFLIEKGYLVEDKITSDGEVLIDPRNNNVLHVTAKITINKTNKKISVEIIE